jgi:hypothetical protein
MFIIRQIYSNWQKEFGNNEHDDKHYLPLSSDSIDFDTFNRQISLVCDVASVIEFCEKLRECNRIGGFVAAVVQCNAVCVYEQIIDVKELGDFVQFAANVTPITTNSVESKMTETIKY